MPESMLWLDLSEDTIFFKFRPKSYFTNWLTDKCLL